MAKRDRGLLEFSMHRELENASIWCIVILLVAIVLEDVNVFLKILPLLVAGAAGTLLVNAKNHK
jgi:hypothetical protein